MKKSIAGAYGKDLWALILTLILLFPYYFPLPLSFFDYSSPFHLSIFDFRLRGVLIFDYGFGILVAFIPRIIIIFAANRNINVEGFRIVSSFLLFVALLFWITIIPNQMLPSRISYVFLGAAFYFLVLMIVVLFSSEKKERGIMLGLYYIIIITALFIYCTYRLFTLSSDSDDLLKNLFFSLLLLSILARAFSQYKKSIKNT